MVSASGVVLQAGSLPTRRSTIANPTRPTQSVNRQRAVPKDVAPIIKNIRIIYIHTYVQAYTQTCPCTSTHLFAYVLICPSPANPPTSVCSYVHTRATSNAGLRRRNCASTFVSGTLAGPDHNLESSLDDLREAARLMPTSAVLFFGSRPFHQNKQANSDDRYGDPQLSSQMQRASARRRALSNSHKKSDHVGRCEMLSGRPWLSYCRVEKRCMQNLHSVPVYASWRSLVGMPKMPGARPMLHNSRTWYVRRNMFGTCHFPRTFSAQGEAGFGPRHR